MSGGCGAEYGELAGHTPADEWHSDSLMHWKECIKCEVRIEKAEHKFNETGDGKDSCVCGCVAPSQETNGVAAAAAVLGGIAAAGAAGVAALSLANKKRDQGNRMKNKSEVSNKVTSAPNEKRGIR